MGALPPRGFAQRAPSIRRDPSSARLIPTGHRSPPLSPDPDEKLVQTADELAEPNPGPAGKIGGARSLIAVPMRKDDDLIGAFVIYRTEIRPFSNKQIELVQNFAAQAVIAIENARLLKRAAPAHRRPDRVAGQQTATSEVLGVIAGLPGN